MPGASSGKTQGFFLFLFCFLCMPTLASLLQKGWEVASNWQGLEGNGIIKEKSFSLRPRWGKKVSLTIQRDPTEFGVHWHQLILAPENWLWHFQEFFQLVDVKLAASQQPYGRICTIKISKCFKSEGPSESRLLNLTSTPLHMHWGKHCKRINERVGPREVGMYSLGESAGGDGSEQRYQEWRK